MVIRTGRYGKFKCCSAYPECKNIVSNDELTEETCEKCGAKMLLKNGRFGKYYACSAYPECQNNRPLGEKPSEEKCEVCGANLVVRSGKFGDYLRCKACKSNKPLAKPTGKCPECGKDVYLRKGKFGRNFLACSGYPECKYTSSKVDTEKKKDES